MDHRDDVSPSSYASSARSEHDEENNNNCNKDRGTDTTLVISPHRSAMSEHSKNTDKQDSTLSNTSSGLPPTMKKDVHYYAILARIHKAVNSSNNTPSLGSILADANKRGMSLDSVIELYKEERIKSLQGSCEINAASPNMSSTVNKNEINDADNDEEERCGFDDLAATILIDSTGINGHRYDASTGNIKVVSEVDHSPELAIQDETHGLRSCSPAAEDDITILESVVEAKSDFIEWTSPSANGFEDDDSECAMIILKVSSEVVEYNETTNQFKEYPDPPGYSHEYETHPDPPGLSLDDISEADSCSSSSLMTQEHQDASGNGVEVLLMKTKVTGGDDSVSIDRNHTWKECLGDVKGGEITSYRYEAHPDPPGQSYSSTIEPSDTEDDNRSCTATNYEHGSVSDIALQATSEREDDKEDTIHYDDVGSYDEDGQQIIGEDESVDYEDARPDPPGVSSSSTSDTNDIDAVSCSSSSSIHEHKADDSISSSTTHEHENGVEIVLKDSANVGGESDMIYSDDMEISHFFSTSTKHQQNDEVAEATLYDDSSSDVECCEDASTLSELDEAESVCFGSTKTPKHKNTSQQNQNAFGNDAATILEDLEESVRDEFETSHSLGVALTQELIDDETTTSGNATEVLLSINSKDTDLVDTEGTSLHLDMQEFVSPLANDADGICTASYFSASAALDNGVEIVLNDSSSDDAKKCTGSCSPTRHIDISNEDSQDLWIVNSDEVEGNENADENDQSDTPSALDSDEEESQSGPSLSQDLHADAKEETTGVEIVLNVSSTSSDSDNMEQHKCDDAKSCRGSCSPTRHIDDILTSILNTDSKDLWIENSDEMEGIENADELDSDEEESQTGSSLSIDLHDDAEETTSDRVDDEMFELSRIFNQATAVANDGLGLSGSEEASEVQQSDSECTIASFRAYEEPNESSTKLDDSQLAEFAKKAEELIEADRLPLASSNDASDAENTRIQVASFPSESMTGDKFEEVGAFFSRFSIETDEEPVENDCSECHEYNDLVNEGGDCEIAEKDIATDEGGEEKPHAERCAPKSKKDKTKDLGLLSDEGSNLPNNFGLWKSPWQKTKIPQRRVPDIGQYDTTDTDGSSECSSRKKDLDVERRLMGHSGYSNIDFYSLYEASLVKAEEEDIDQAPWEYRDVGQRFLHEKSLESRNWFGKILFSAPCNFRYSCTLISCLYSMHILGSFELVRGNDRLQYPVCCPKALEVSVTRIPDEGEWSEDWFTTWKSRKDNPNNLETFAQDEKENLVNGIPGASFAAHRENDHVVGKNVVVEIGSLCPVRVKPGERISRIHPEYTSSLRQSRWRKRYIKGHMFASV